MPSPSKKSKSRFDGLDVCAMVCYLRRELLGRRIINIYDGVGENDCFLFKFEALQSGQEKKVLFLESGTRFHLTHHLQTLQASQQQQGTNNNNMMMPSPFCSKLRKHMRGLRLEKITQLGKYDRVVHFVFGSGEKQRHSLLLELYARGNLILTDSTYTILALLRSHEFHTNNKNDNTTTTTTNQAIKVQVGHVYPLTHATTTTTTTTTTDERDDESSLLCNLTTNEECMEWVKKELAPSSVKPENNNKKKGSSAVIPLKALMLRPSSGFSHYGPSLIEHCLLAATTSSSSPHHVGNVTKLSYDKPGVDLNWMLLLETFNSEGKKVMQHLEMDDVKGYILYRPKTEDNNNNNNKSTAADDDEDKKSDPTNTDDTTDKKILVDFQPHLLLQHEAVLGNTTTATTTTPHNTMEFPNFSQAVDTYFAHIGHQKRTLRMEAAERVAQQRLDKIKLDQERRVQELEQQIIELQQSAQLVERHAVQVDQAIQVINSALDSGMDWEALQTLVQVEQEQNFNPIALLIHELKLEQNAMIVRLKDDDDDDDEEKDKIHNIQISLDDTAHGNARAMFAKYRTFKEKSQKTLDNANKALKAAEATAQKHIAEAQQKNNSKGSGGILMGTVASTTRKPHWFEKFHWFITSDNYLVLGGRDAHQNEMLVKRYLRPGDAYLHADVHGAASCILRAKRRKNLKTGKTEPIPLPTLALREAGNFTICRSSAWSSRQITSAWWVEAHQVSKTAPTGEYLTVGSFMVRGRKNFLPPTQLEMGLGVLFRLGDEESIARHGKERRDFALLLEQEEEEEEKDDAYSKTKKLPVQPAATKERRLVDDMVDSTLSEPTTVEVKSDYEPEQSEENDENDKPVDEVRVKSAGAKKQETGAFDDRGGGEEKSTASAIPPEEVEKRVLKQVPEATEEATTAEESNNNNTVDYQQALKSDDNTTISTATTNTTKKKKKGLSVKERKLIRKYGSLEAAQKAMEEREQQERERGMASEESSLVTMSTITTNSTNGGGGSVAKRGKKSKMKRAARKYADQDQEDRELALLALHGGEDKGTPRRKNGKPTIKEVSESEQKAAAETTALLIRDSKEVADQLPQEIRAVLEECLTVYGNDDNVDEEVEPVVRWDKMDADVLEQIFGLKSEEQMLAAVKRLLFLKQSTRVDNFSSSLSGIIRTIKKYGHENLEVEASSEAMDGGKRKTKAERQAEQEAWKEALAEEGIAEEDGNSTGAALDDTTELNKLTGKPQPEDSILYAVPVCAPYQTLSQYKYRVKLTPGNQKRGKAAKQCLELLLEQDKASQQSRNRELIKHVADNEWVQVICADVKISAAGAAKVKGGKGRGGGRGGGKKGKRR